MPRYKRSANEAELDVTTPDDRQPEQDGILSKLRNMWEFASFMQFIFIFGAAVKISEDFDIEDLEQECLLQQSSTQLADMALTLLKYVSSHRGLTHDIFAEYARRQYFAKAPDLNPFGDEEDSIPFNELDIYTRIRVLQQLSTWTFTNPDRMRSLMPEDDDHLDWRIEPLGWDADDRAYFVLDDNRLYRRTDEPIAPPTPPVKAKAKPKAKSKRAAPSRGTRTSKRRKIEDSSDEEDVQEEEIQHVEVMDGESEGGYGFTDRTWECIAITLEQYQEFLSTIRKSRDPNEKALRNRIESDVLPIIEKRAEALRAKEMRKLRELEALQKLATAKRSSRIADKADRAAKEQEERDAEEKRTADLRMAREEQERQRRIEDGHESRRLTREQRLKEREVKRILHEEELARLEREGSAIASQPDTEQVNGVRLSSRNLQTQKEAHRKELDRLQHAQQEDIWYFDCVICGMHGENLDDGSHSVACERCNVWQHSKCHGFTPEQCEDENFHFICRSCRKKERAEQAEQRSGITLKLGKRPSESPQPSVKKELPDYIQRQLNGMSQHSPQAANQQFVPPMYSQPQQWHNGTVLPRPQQMQPPQPYHSPTQVPPFQSHAQQHEAMHNRAVNGAGGHPSPSMQQPLPQSSPVGQLHSGFTRPQTTPRPVSNISQLQPNGSAPRDVLQTPQVYRAPVYQPSPLHSSPHTSLLPPSTGYNQRAAVSPEKSSPPRPAQEASATLNGQPSPRLTAETATLSTPNTSFDNAPKLATPNKNSASPLANDRTNDSLAASGMRGPWPDGSMAVPQKAASSHHHTTRPDTVQPQQSMSRSDFGQPAQSIARPDAAHQFHPQQSIFGGDAIHTQPNKSRPEAVYLQQSPARPDAVHLQQNVARPDAAHPQQSVARPDAVHPQQST